MIIIAKGQFKGFNNYEIRGEDAVLLIEHKNEIIECFVDFKKLDKLIKAGYRWNAQWDKGSQTYYVRTMVYPSGEHPKTISIHRFLTDATEKYIRVDHKDHNGLNNRETNLRVTLHPNNNQNRKSKNSNNKSGYRNVFWDSGREKWKVSLCKNYKHITIGYFDDVDEAGKAAEEARRNYFGKFAGLS